MLEDEKLPSERLTHNMHSLSDQGLKFKLVCYREEEKMKGGHVEVRAVGALG